MWKVRLTYLGIVELADFWEVQYQGTVELVDFWEVIQVPLSWLIFGKLGFNILVLLSWLR